jgi:HD-GYP domain-containing protein (c-di-GMP phosphodiesterase class II)
MNSTEFQKMMGRVVNQFTAAVENASIYPYDHPQVLSCIHETYRLLDELLEGKREITILLIGDSLMVAKLPLIIAGTGKNVFIQILRKNLIERVTFIRGLSFAQLEEFVRNLSAASLSAMRSIPYIRFGKLEVKDHDDWDTDDDSSAEETGPVHDMQDQNNEERIKNIYRNTLDGEKINPEDADELVRDFMDSIHREADPLRLLAETKTNDEYTFTHTANVGILVLFFAEHLGFKGSHLNNFGVAAILHDVGKVTIPDEILSKTGSLSADERSVMEMHAIKGALNLMEQANITNLAVLAALEHHMKFDGTGYPCIKGGWEQSIVSQIISIVDVYDALRTIRPYRPNPMPLDRIIQILTGGRGTDFNPDLVDRFLPLVSR